MGRNRPLIILGVAQSVSATGTWVTIMAVYSLVLFQGQGGVLESSSIMLAGLLPMLLASPLTGRLSDLTDRRTVMIASELLSGAAVAVMIVTPQIELIYVLLAVQGVFASAVMPARQAVMPDLVERDNLVRANAFLQQLSSIITVAAPILAGALLSIVSPRSAMLVDVASYAIAAAILTRLPSLRAKTALDGPNESGRAAKTPWRAALGVVAGVPMLRVMFLAAFFLVIIIVGYDVLAPVYARDVLRGGQGLFGLMIGLSGLGTASATLILMLRKGHRDARSDLPRGTLLLACLPLSLGMGSLLGNVELGLALALTGSVVGGFGAGLLMVQGATVLQLFSPPNLLGSVTGLFQSTLVAGQLIVILATPVLIPLVVSMTVYFLAATVALFVLAAVAARAFRSALPEKLDEVASLEG